MKVRYQHQGLQTHLLSFSVALEHKHAEGRFSVSSVTPISPLQNETHQPAVLLMGCELRHVLQLELTDRQRTEIKIQC